MQKTTISNKINENNKKDSCNVSIFPRNIVVDIYNFFDSTKLKTIWIKNTFFKRRVSIIL